jgi:uncharacterized coiled-coil protein SlyX
MYASGILMNEQLENRLAELNAELASGQRMLAELEAKETDLRATLSRISGAIKVIEDELGEENANQRTRAIQSKGIPRKIK